MCSISRTFCDQIKLSVKRLHTKHYKLRSWKLQVTQFSVKQSTVDVKWRLNGAKENHAFLSLTKNLEPATRADKEPTFIELRSSRAFESWAPADVKPNLPENWLFVRSVSPDLLFRQCQKTRQRQAFLSLCYLGLPRRRKGIAALKWRRTHCFSPKFR